MVIMPRSNILNNLLLDIRAAHQQLDKQAEKRSFVSLLKRLFDINYLAKDTFFCNPYFT